MDKKLRLFIADDDKEYCSKLISEIERTADKLELIGYAHDGMEALNRIAAGRPDVVLLDIVMPEMDGFGVLSALREVKNRPKIVIVSALRSDKITQKAMELGADYYICKPVLPGRILQRVIDLFGSCKDYTVDACGFVWPEEWPNRMESAAESEVRSVLQQLSFMPHLSGYRYLREIILLVLKERGMLDEVTKKLYPEIARRFKTTPSRVERSARYAIETAWNKGDVDKLNQYFGFTVNADKGKPTNSEFVAMVVDRIDMRMARVR